MTQRHVKIPCKQTGIGAAWVIAQPLVAMLVFSLFFGRVAANAASSLPYSVFILAGLVSWMFLTNAITSVGQSVVGNNSLVTKVYFRCLIIRIGQLDGLVELAIAPSSWPMSDARA